MSDFIFDKHKIFDKYESLDEDITFIKKRKFIFDSKSINSLRTNCRESYQALANIYSRNDISDLFEVEHYKNDYGTLHNVIVTPYGHIYVRDKDNTKWRMFTNGGCRCNRYSKINGVNSVEDSIITIASMWADGIWHFPYEAFVALKTIPMDILCKTKIHITGDISKYVMQWFDMIGIKYTQIVKGVVFAKTVYVPRMGRCGNPYYSQMLWLKDIIYKHIGITHSLERVILIKRTKRRTLKNYNELYSYVKKFASRVGLPLYIHDDSSLPSLTEQQRMFSGAKYVFAPHGAGGIHLAVMDNRAWFIELLNSRDINICYSRLAYLYDINYTGITIENDIIDVEHLDKHISTHIIC